MRPLTLDSYEIWPTLLLAISCCLMPRAQVEIKPTCKNELGKPKNRRGVGFAERTDWTGSPRGKLDRILGKKDFLRTDLCSVSR